MRRLLLTSGRGPAECRIAVAHALTRLAAEAEAADCDCAIAPGEADRHGPASAVVVLDGPGADALAQRWTRGSLLWVCRSPLRPHHGRKNWFIGVIDLPLPPMVPALAAADIRFESFRAGGPGGQHQNKTESAVRAVHLPSGLTAIARDGRSQHRNKALALARLAALLDGRARVVEAGEARLMQAAHDRVERGAAGLRFEGPAFRPAG
ncbi:putative Class I peptide chain release factor domain protein [Bradyrhizobium sp. ORS 285]|uniref:peptide chain release factor H n=1 Tax=Bradyrhizobium sp. ORS 285 TaxID=115808 RepID=UPI000240A010|nr:peptide chain release factor H [Bradyrhizobium sp. ORS 285]CCD86401.1 putative Class I peptide chain release factor domain protein [Bradyrhizobium sp. ORS 285]SMX61134.1 putative Class I peptide chain release factor domain protein [Bradyrhizobium sp. ORS 285]